jgi:hypothetical protein
LADKRLFDGLDPLGKQSAQEALAFLAETGCLARYTNRRLLEVVEGSLGQSNEDLLESIQRVRADTQGIMALHHYGLKLAQEMKGTRNEDS